MNKAAFLQIINQIDAIKAQEVNELEKLVDNFPYCQTAHMLIAKASYDQGNMLSTQKLRKAASYAVNRQLLKKLIYTTKPSITLQTVSAAKENSTKNLPAPEKQQNEVNNTLVDKADTEIIVSEPIKTDPEALPIIADTQTPEVATTIKETEISETAPETEAPAIKPNPVIVTPSAPEKDKPEIDEPVENEPAISDAETPETFTEQEEAKQGISDKTLEETKTPELNLPEPAPQTESKPEPVILNTDSELFKPENDQETNKEEAGAVKVSFSDNAFENIFSENELGYWMNSSRLGESLQLKDELTSAKPQDFHPELLYEYSKSHEITHKAEPVQNPVQSKQQDIIDQFLKQNPKLKTMSHTKIKTEPQEDLSLKSTRLKKVLASESLANIYVQQGKIKKAIKIYEQLILKYPEKKAYFAEHITNLKN